MAGKISLRLGQLTQTDGQDGRERGQDGQERGHGQQKGQADQKDQKEGTGKHELGKGVFNGSLIDVVRFAPEGGEGGKGGTGGTENGGSADGGGGALVFNARTASRSMERLVHSLDQTSSSGGGVGGGSGSGGGGGGMMRLELTMEKDETGGAGASTSSGGMGRLQAMPYSIELSYHSTSPLSDTQQQPPQRTSGRDGTPLVITQRLLKASKEEAEAGADVDVTSKEEGDLVQVELLLENTVNRTLPMVVARVGFPAGLEVRYVDFISLMRTHGYLDI